MRYMDSIFIRTKVVVAEWAHAEGVTEVEILRRICAFGEAGVIFDNFSFKRYSDKVFIGFGGIRNIIGLLQSQDVFGVKDGQEALEDLLMSEDALRDFCQVTRTRLPDCALGIQHRSVWSNYSYKAPPNHEPTAQDVELSRLLQLSKGKSRAEKRAAASISLSRARGFPPSRRSPRAIHEMSSGARGAALSADQPSVPGSAPSVPAEATTKDRSSARSAKKWRGYVEKDDEVIAWVLALMDEEGISCNAAVQRIPDGALAGVGTLESRRARIYKRIQKTPNR